MTSSTVPPSPGEMKIGQLSQAELDQVRKDAAEFLSPSERQWREDLALTTIAVALAASPPPKAADIPAIVATAYDNADTALAARSAMPPAKKKVAP